MRPTSGAFLSSGKLVLEGDGNVVQKQVHLQILDGNVGWVGIGQSCPQLHCSASGQICNLQAVMKDQAACHPTVLMCEENIGCRNTTGGRCR